MEARGYNLDYVGTPKLNSIKPNNLTLRKKKKRKKEIHRRKQMCQDTVHDQSYVKRFLRPCEVTPSKQESPDFCSFIM